MAAVTICGFAASAPTSSSPQNIAPAHHDRGRPDRDFGRDPGRDSGADHRKSHSDHRNEAAHSDRRNEAAGGAHRDDKAHGTRRDDGGDRSRFSRTERRRPLSRSTPAYTRPISESVPVSAQWGVPGGWAAGHHTGVDFAAPAGTPVHSVGTGTVELAGDAGSYGNAVIVHMDDGKHALFGHLSAIDVEQGRRVEAGTRLGASGNTGRSTGPHLHFEVREQPEYGTEVDPLPYLAEHGVHIA